MDSVYELERKISDYERKISHYEYKIRRLEHDLFERDHEIIRAKFSILKGMPDLTSPNDPLVDIVRVPGYLDPKMFERACLNIPCDDREDEAERKERAIVEAETLYNEWRNKTSNGVWELYVTVPEHGEGENGLMPVEVPDLLDLKDKYGEELYNAIKIAWAESQERIRTGVQLKPWDYEAGREQTLTEILEEIDFISTDNQ